jgi:hypothetical protein
MYDAVVPPSITFTHVEEGNHPYTPVDDVLDDARPRNTIPFPVKIN